MRRKLVRIRSRQVLLVILGLGIALAMATPALAATRYEYCDSAITDVEDCYDGIWLAQTFTPSVAHTVTSVRLMLHRQNAPGTVTVGIRATSGGNATGGDLCSGTIDGNTLATSQGTWYEIALGSGYSLSAGTMYAIVVRAPGGNSTNRLIWPRSYPDPYAGGSYIRSTDSGGTWSAVGGGVYDLLFEEWGTAGVGWETYPVNKVRVLLPWIALFAAIAAGVSLVVLRRRRAQT